MKCLPEVFSKYNLQVVRKKTRESFSSLMMRDNIHYTVALAGNLIILLERSPALHVRLFRSRRIFQDNNTSSG